jgi:alpha-tubulin suppressor-like RCC1 family protein
MFIKNGSYKKHTHIISYVPPTIITQPVGGTKNVGSSHKFTILAKGSRPLTYQWYKNSTIIVGETSKELNLTNLQVSDDANYYCEVRNNGYLITSNTVKLTVLVDISFITQPTSLQVNPNSNVSFTASAVGTPPISYKWYKNSVIYTGTTHTIFINNVTKNEEGSYFVVASNLLTSITSNTATLSVNEIIVIKDQPDDTSLNVGDNLTLSLSCAGTFPISAQWRKNNTNYGSLSVTNTGDVELEITNVQYTDEGNYDCVLSNLVGSVTSNKAIFYINKPPVFTLNPSDGTGYTGQSFTFTSNATGTNPISYQWIKEDFGNVNGATLKNYTLDNITFSNSGKYACVASNLYGTVTSTFASLSVENAILITPINNKIGAGYYHSLAIGTNGILSSWGLNYSGQLGNGTTTNRSTPVKINIPAISSIYAGGYNSLIIGTDKGLSGFGDNSYGQLGNGTTLSASSPIKINLPPVAIVAADISHSLAVGIDGGLSAWGYNNNGQLGNGTTLSASSPIKINLPPVSMVATGSNYSLAVGIDGGLSAWGNNSYGQLGNGTTLSASSPIKINLSPITMVAAGFRHSLVVGTDGGLSAWGRNNTGQLGDGTTTDRLTPVKISLPPVYLVAAGSNHSLAVGIDGGLSAWGSNQFGQLGDGTTTNRSTPVKINLPSISGIDAGWQHSLALGKNGTLSAWGLNTNGQLGDGTTTNRFTPVKINLPPIL